MKTVGILGGGQLAMMLAEAAKPLGIRVLCASDDQGCPASHVTSIFPCDFSVPDFIYPLDLEELGRRHSHETPEQTLSSVRMANESENNPRTSKTMGISPWQKFIEQVDVITYEWENIPAKLLELLVKHRPVHPAPKALEICQDRLLEKRFFKEHGALTPTFEAVDSLASLETACKNIGFPCVLKTRKGGYDGKGQWLLKNHNDAKTAWQEANNKALILEQFIPFEAEVSLIAVASEYERAYYPLIKNTHTKGILRLSEAPYSNTSLQEDAEQLAENIIMALDYRGVMAIEFFVYNDELWFNECAPRVHNSGHWTIEGAKTSQFSNHLRAICGLPLGSTAAVGYSAMINIIGDTNLVRPLLDIPHTHYHDYYKSPRMGRKLAHITLHDRDMNDYNDSLVQIKNLLKSA